MTPEAGLRTQPSPAVQARLDALNARLEAVSWFNIGFPAAGDLDFRPLTGYFGELLNNLGDPFIDGAYPRHTKDMEREVVELVADLLRAPADDRWGYVAGGASEGIAYALRLARTRYPDGIVYHSAAAHHSVANAVHLLGMRSVVVRADAHGELDYADLATVVGQRRDRPAVVVANIGSPADEAVDDVRRITAELDGLAVRRRWIHADAALSGIPLALLDPEGRPGFDFADGADSVDVSGHKFLGTPLPCAVVVVRASQHRAHARNATYTGSPDTTVTNSRPGHAALLLWWAMMRYGMDTHRARAAAARDLAEYAHQRLIETGWPAHRHPHAFTVALRTPPKAVTDTWTLAHHGDRSHLICMPGVRQAQIDAFVADLQAATSPAAGRHAVGRTAAGRTTGDDFAVADDTDTGAADISGTTPPGLIRRAFAPIAKTG
ncbi:MAG TPA: histidine decarboxylase [Pilimelia sp.]|nr:histidine decarboxylase [Pilimelia sp.]